MFPALTVKTILKLKFSSNRIHNILPQKQGSDVLCITALFLLLTNRFINDKLNIGLQIVNQKE